VKTSGLPCAAVGPEVTARSRPASSGTRQAIKELRIIRVDRVD
jgi:hypothetical protein